MKKRSDNILAEGEATGHFHAVEGDADVFGGGAHRRIVARSDSKVTHHEHHTQPLSTGEYDTSIVREFDPFEEEIRNVVD